MDSYLCFQLALLHFFFLSQSPSLSLCMVFYSISSKIDEILSTNPSTNVFIFQNFNIPHKDWLSYSGGTDRPGELCYNVSISNGLNQMANFPTWILNCDSQSCSFGFTYFFQCYYLYYNGFPSIGKFWSCCYLSFHWLSKGLTKTHKETPRFIA